MIQSRLSILENSDIGEEATAKIMEVKRRNRHLEKHITMQEEEIQVGWIHDYILLAVYAHPRYYSFPPLPSLEPPSKTSEFCVQNWSSTQPR